MTGEHRYFRERQRVVLKSTGELGTVERDGTPSLTYVVFDSDPVRLYAVLTKNLDSANEHAQEAGR